MIAAVQKCALDSTYSPQPRSCDADCISGYDHNGKVRENVAALLTHDINKIKKAIVITFV